MPHFGCFTMSQHSIACASVPPDVSRLHPLYACKGGGLGGCDAMGARATSLTSSAVLRGARNVLACMMAGLTWLAARRVTMAGCRAHARALLFGALAACTRLSLDVQVGMGCRDRAIPLAFAAGIDANGNGLRGAGRRLDIEAHAEDASLPEAGGLAALEPASRSRGCGRHQRMLALIYDPNKEVCHPR